MKWISIKDKKPSKNKAILVWHAKCDSAHEVYYDEDAWSHVDCGGGMRVGTIAIDFEFEYWMPLPDKPKVDE